MTFKFPLTGAAILSLGTVLLAYAADPQFDDERFARQIGSEVGVPEPGSLSDQETTKKRRDPAKDQRADQNAQVTIGGAKSSVSGAIRNIQGDQYFIKDEESGDEVRLLVNIDTNLDCSAAQSPMQGTASPQAVAADRQSGEQQAPQASHRQKEQGQKNDETAMGSGFRIGTCSFKPGDRIRAEVDDMGRVTTLRIMPETGRAALQRVPSLRETAGTGELAMPGKQDKPGQLDMTGPEGYPPKQYALLPVPLGKFMIVSKHDLLGSPIYDHDGKVVGSLETFIMDSETGRIEYAIVLVNDTHRLEVAPWAHFRVQQNSDEKKLLLNTQRYQLSPDTTVKDGVDQSPDLEKLAKSTEGVKAPADLRYEDGGVSKSVSKTRPSPDLCANKDCHVIRGRILQQEGSSFVIKENSGKEVRMTVDRKTEKGQVGIAGRDEEFTIGDSVEAYITSTGHAESITLMRPNSTGRPEEAGG